MERVLGYNRAEIQQLIINDAAVKTHVSPALLRVDISTVDGKVFAVVRSILGKDMWSPVIEESEDDDPDNTCG